eukprot:180295_1
MATSAIDNGDKTQTAVDTTTDMISSGSAVFIDSAGSVVTNKSMLNRLKGGYKFIQQRKWMATCRGIPEFVSPTEFCRPKSGEIWKRLRANTEYFFTNYMACSLLIFSFTILTDPWLFFGMLGIGYLWFIAAKQEKLSIGKFSLSGNKKFGVLCIITVVVMILLGFHETIFVTIAISSALVFAHAVMHKMPDSANDVLEDDLILLG